MDDLTTATVATLIARNEELGRQQIALRQQHTERLEAAEALFQRERAPLRAERAAIAAELARRGQ